MRGLAVLLAMLLLEAAAVAQEAGALPEFIIDVVDFCFICGDEVLYLDPDTARPIEVYTDGNDITVRVQSPERMTELALGQGHATLTDRALPYVQRYDAAPAPTPAPEICDICGRSKALGNHERLPCGHQGCMVVADHLDYCTACGKYKCDGRDHSTCSSCGVKWCVHVDLECEYTRNPAPTAVAYAISEDATLVEGTSGKASQWTPGEDYYKQRKKDAGEDDEEERGQTQP